MPDDTPDSPAADTGERIAKRLARAGLCSRRDAERWIAEGRVAVNGKVLDSPAVNIRPGDRVTVDGKPLPQQEPTRVWRYHKPAGLVTTARDEKGRATVFDELPEELPRVISVGRLDLNTEGLLLLTNDGALARHLELPATGWPRRYRVRVHGEPDPQRLAALAHGIMLDGVEYGPIEAVLDREQGANAWLTMTLREGKNREIRKVLEHLGLVVNRLIRVSYGPFQLGKLPPGEVEEVPRRVLRDQLPQFFPKGEGTGEAKAAPAPRLRFDAVPKPKGPRADKAPARAERAAQGERPARGERPFRDERPGRDERPFRDERPARGDTRDGERRPSRARDDQPARAGRTARDERPARSSDRADARRPARADDRQERPARARPDRAAPTGRGAEEPRRERPAGAPLRQGRSPGDVRGGKSASAKPASAKPASGGRPDRGGRDMHSGMPKLSDTARDAARDLARRMDRAIDRTPEEDEDAPARKPRRPAAQAPRPGAARPEGKAPARTPRGRDGGREFGSRDGGDRPGKGPGGTRSNAKGPNAKGPGGKGPGGKGPGARGPGGKGADRRR